MRSISVVFPIGPFFLSFLMGHLFHIRQTDRDGKQTDTHTREADRQTDRHITHTDRQTHHILYIHTDRHTDRHITYIHTYIQKRRE